MSLYIDNHIFNRTKKIWKQYIIFFAILFSVACCIYIYIFHKPHRDFYAEQASYFLTPQELLSAFKYNEIQANEKYLNQVVQINGMVTKIDNNGPNLCEITIDNNIFCFFEQMADIHQGQEITIKGRCIGYDDFFGDVTLTKCMIMK